MEESQSAQDGLRQRQLARFSRDGQAMAESRKHSSVVSEDFYSGIKVYDDLRRGKVTIGNAKAREISSGFIRLSTEGAAAVTAREIAILSLLG